MVDGVQMRHLSTHLQSLTLVELSLSKAIDLLESQLARFGPTERLVLHDWEAVKRFLLPLKSFPTRYVLGALSSWTVLLADMYGESCYVNALGMSKSSGCRAVSTYFLEDGRHWRLIERGEEIRAVVCYADGDRWVFHQTGIVGSWEAIQAYSARRIRDRLTPAHIGQYLYAVTGVSLPLDWATALIEAIGIERSTKDVVQPVRLWHTEDDI